MSEEIPPFDLDSAFVLLVHQCSRYLKHMTSDGVSFHRRMACSWWVLSGSKTPDEVSTDQHRLLFRDKNNTPGSRQNGSLFT